MKDKVESAKRDGSSGVLAIFDFLDEWINCSSFWGCNFINVSGEYADSGHPIHIFAKQHKRSVVELINTHLETENSGKAEQLALLLDGAIVMAHTHGEKNAAKMAKEMAQNICG